MAAQKTDELSWLIIRNGAGQYALSHVRFLVTEEDLEYIVPALERLGRSKNNPHFSFKVESR